ncbi:HHIP-like protein 1 [Elysia marginata]|uniref:HHIP-like protein 1 n=1 Tax=Elysia marginata TaxID=1093978 RepID=A0AAV4GZT0_9GAST|nr:HHIP-like protein 1 [Elysia marginata]
MEMTKASKLPRNISVVLVLLCGLIQLSVSLPRRPRQPVTYLTKRVPPPSLFSIGRSPRGDLDPGVRGDVPVLTEDTVQRAALRSGLEESTALEVEEAEEDYDYVDNDVYQFAHFWESMSNYVASLVYYTNETLSDGLAKVNDKVAELETRMSERDEEFASLKKAFEKLTEEAKEPELGDVRLVDQEEDDNETRGTLLFFAGESLGWGYVCDDMFSSVAATVACKQLGYSSGQVDVTTRDLSFSFDRHDRKYSIVLDDVVCSESHADLLACEHLPIGVHNCGKPEAIHLKCFR